MVKKWLHHFMKNLRFFVNSCPSDDGLSYMAKNGADDMLSAPLPSFLDHPLLSGLPGFHLFYDYVQVIRYLLLEISNRLLTGFISCCIFTNLISPVCIDCFIILS